MLFDPIKVCWVHQLRDALEEESFAAADELEKLDEEEGEGWGTIKVHSPPCELGASVGSTSGLLRTEPARRGASDARDRKSTRLNSSHRR